MRMPIHFLPTPEPLMNRDQSNLQHSTLAAPLRAALGKWLGSAPIAFEVVRAELAVLLECAPPVPVETASASGALRAPPDADTDLRALLRLCGDLLSDGVTVFASARAELDSAMRQTLVLERVTRSGAGLRKTVLKAGPGALFADPRARAHYAGEPAMQLYDNPISIVDEPGAHDADAPARLREQDLAEFFRNKQRIVDGIASAIGAHHGQDETAWRAAVRANRAMVLRTFEQLRADPARPASKVTRLSHPAMKPMLHVLPRLLVSGDGDGVLALLKGGLAQLREMGFSTLMLGCVDKQASDIHFGEDDYGHIFTYANNHGYWSSGEAGLDPMLGSAQDYLALADSAREHDVLLMQDTVLASLGYPAQLGRLARVALNEPAHCLMLGQDEVSICSADAFLHASCVPEEDSLDEQVTPELYADVVAQSHCGSLYALPKPNLFDPAVLEATLARARWQIGTARISAFRIDMAKHIGPLQLQTIIATLRAECAQAGTGVFSVLLEYWTTRYRDLKFAMLSIAPESAGAYFYDFPLAQALQDILIKNCDVGETLAELVGQRARWGIDLHQMIPTFIDHDFSFRPIYNGDSATRAMVVVGYALAAMLSANAPYVYFAYDKSDCALSEHEEFSRTMVSELFAHSDQGSPADPIADLLHALARHPIFSSWSDGAIAVDGDVYSATLTRTLLDAAGEIVSTVEAHFSRFCQNAPAHDDGSVIFFYGHGPSILIRQVDGAP